MKNIIIRQLSLLLMIIILSASQLRADSLINDSFLKNINTNGDETSCSITGDGKYFLFAKKAKDQPGSNLYFSEFKDGKWSEAKASSELNSDADDISPYISPDGKLVLFSSNRQGSLKNNSADKPSYDIYYSEKKDGVWSKPELLFGTVNTTDDEVNPFMTKEGNVLYFTRLQSNDNSKATIIKVYNKDDSWEDIQTSEISRNSFANIYMYKKSLHREGSYFTGSKKVDLKNRDVFYAEGREDDISELNIMQDGVNTPGDEISITELSKDSIIISSNQNGIENSYDFSLKKINSKSIAPAIKNELPKILSIKVESENYSNPEGIKIKVLFFSSLKKNSWPLNTEFKTPDSSGMISISVSPDIKRVLLLPGTSGMKSFSVEFLTKKDSASTATIKIEPSRDKEFTAKPVYFNFNSSELRITDIPYIHELIDYLRQNKSFRVSLEGYSDGIGSYKANLDMSVRRAEKLKEYIIKAGISKSRIRTKGFGYIKEKTPETSQYSRRVETNLITEK